MKPILLIHGYSTEGRDNTVEKIYGSLPAELRKIFGRNVVKELNLSRWISLSDGITLDDVSFAMDRALKADFPDLLESGFHVIIHSTGALVARNWIKNFSPAPSPIANLVHLAGANFGSGLAHVGQGPLSRWKNLIFEGTGVGTRVLGELEFGSWKTLDLHRHFLEPGKDMLNDYRVQEFCIIGSQTLAALRLVPIRYVKEDSSDNTVRTSATNLNWNYVRVTPRSKTLELSVRRLGALVKRRLANREVSDTYYQYDLSKVSETRTAVPFAIVFETAHFGGDIGIVAGKKNRPAVMPLIKSALSTDYGTAAYERTRVRFEKATERTFERAARLRKLLEWNEQCQYEGHAQVIFRLKDQFGDPVEDFDITFKSDSDDPKTPRLERMIEDKHENRNDSGAVTYYFRTVKFKKKRSKPWVDRLRLIAPVNVEITGHETKSEEIAYVPLTLKLDRDQVGPLLQTFRTTVIDVTLVRLPSERVFEITRK